MVMRHKYKELWTGAGRNAAKCTTCGLSTYLYTFPGWPPVREYIMYDCAGNKVLETTRDEPPCTGDAFQQREQERDDT